MKKNLVRRFTISLLLPCRYEGSLFTKCKTFMRILLFDLERKHSKTNCWQKNRCAQHWLWSSILHNIYATGNEEHILLQRRRRRELSANMPWLCKLFECLTLLLLVFRCSMGQCSLKTCEKKALNLATDTKRNLFLRGYVLETLSVSSWKYCYFFCMRNCQCLSFNFYESSNKTSNCELNEANTKIVPEALTAKEGVTYFEPLRKYPGKEVCTALNIIELIIL